MYNQLNLSQMGCFSDYAYYEDRNVFYIFEALRKSNDDMIIQFCNIETKKNFDILKRIEEENDILYKKLKDKIDELFKKREEADPLQIAIGKCGNPCYAFQLKLLFICPKCNGKVNRDMENAYTKQVIYDDYSQSFKEVKAHNQKNICTRFDFNENIDKCDVDVDECIKFYEKIDEQKTVHWSCDTKKEEFNKEVPVIPVEKDMPIHYMMLDGERFDFPYGIHMKEFFVLNNNKFFVPYRSEMGSYSYDEKYSINNKMPSHGENCEMFFEKNSNEWGQSCGYYGYQMLHKVFIYECEDCGHKYHVIKSSPFHYRDKSKDPK